MARPDPRPARIPPSARGFLLIQLGDIGDVVLATPTFRAVKETFPAARLSVLVRKGCGSLLAAEPYIDRVLESARSRGKLAEIGRDNLSLLSALRGGRFDVAIDLRTGDRGAILARLTGAPLRISRQTPDDSSLRRRAFTHLIPDPPYAPLPVHPGAEQSLRTVRALGVDTPDSTPRLRVAEGAAARVPSLLASAGLRAEGRYLTVNPFSRWKYKEWPYDRWVGLLDRLWERHRLAAVVVGAREEAGPAEGIVGRCAGTAANLAGRTTLGELAALLSRSALHLGVDSAAPHIAAAVGAPTVTIFGPSNWRSWVVEDATHRVARHDSRCVPCSDKGCGGSGQSVCLEELEVDPVLETAEAVLRDAAR